MQAVGCIASEAGHGFHEHALDLPGFAIPHEALELIALLGTCAGDALVGIDPGKLPIGLGCDLLCVFPHLCGKGVELVV